YSDLGFYLLQLVVEEVSHQSLDQYLQKHLYDPLSLANTAYLPHAYFSRDRIVPTEYDSTFRKQLVQGYVHDPGAAMLGGVGGNAGLFSNANDLAILMQVLL